MPVFITCTTVSVHFALRIERSLVVDTDHRKPHGRERLKRSDPSITAPMLLLGCVFVVVLIIVLDMSVRCAPVHGVTVHCAPVPGVTIRGAHHFEASLESGSAAMKLLGRWYRESAPERSEQRRSPLLKPCGRQWVHDAQGQKLD